MAEHFYQSGFGNHFQSEAIAGALPKVLNNPQKAPLGLIAEQLSGTAFTEGRNSNQKTWLYRIRPSVRHSKFENCDADYPNYDSQPVLPVSPQQMRWDPLSDDLKTPCSFVKGWHTLLIGGDAKAFDGSHIHLYVCNESMSKGKEFFCNADADLLIVPQLGGLEVKTEMGSINLGPGEIVLVPRGVKFQVNLQDGLAKGYICENFGRHFVLPDRGPIGANGLANERDFLAPTAAYEDIAEDCVLIQKFQNHFWRCELEGSPLDVVAWHGNYYPYKYDLKAFNTMNSVSFDHPDPSIFTVMTSPSGTAGVANVDFVIFPERWMVAEKTFRIPYYHRNIMSEYMGLIYGEYDAKVAQKGGFQPGGGSLHNCMTAHGPDGESYQSSLKEELKPKKYEKTMAFMFETRFVYAPTKWALSTEALQENYLDCWNSIPVTFQKK